MITKIHHFEYNVSNLKKTKKFYDNFLKLLGWRRFMTQKDLVGYTNGFTKLFLIQVEKRFNNSGFHRKHIGLNHIAFWVKSRNDVDRFNRFLISKKITVLYGGPRDYSAEYSKGYYAVFFEDPDRIKLEVVFAPELN